MTQVLKLLHREKTKCEKLVLATNELTRRFEGDMEYKLRALNKEVERVMEIGQEMYRVWPHESPFELGVGSYKLLPPTCSRSEVSLRVRILTQN